MSTYDTYDSFTRADGTRYVARYKKDKNIIEKYDADGKRTVISSSGSVNSKSGNKNALAATFDNFKSGLEAAEGGEQLSYGDDSINTNEGSLGRNIFGGNRDALTTLELSDGSILSSGAGKTSNEIATVKRLADEIGAAFIEKEEVDTDVEVDTEVETVLDTVTNDALTNVENISDDTFGVDVETNDGVVNSTDTIENYFDNTLTSAVNTAAGQQTNMESALTTSVGEAEDEAISYMDSGTASNVVNAGGAQGLLAGDDEDEFDPFNRRKTLIGA